ncbi:MAG: aldo/keto reductase [Actinobacteria bacterium]|nr:aldo/keto reductase [Actinomycetota bacterium]MBU4450000.1 aldo/keto reductase [Actinomycetota bacterium]MCG2789998.1 aldo/keto reductase [Actinomycetes bacterium]
MTGRTGLKVSKLCLGTMNFGSYTSEKDSYEIMDKALELGINFFDTANVYGQINMKGIGIGETESIIGRWLSKGNNRREKIVLATKVYGKMGEGPNDKGLSAYNIRKSCNDSLIRLKTDHIDLYQMHHVDNETPWEEIWQAMEQLVREGKIIYVGSSNFAAWNIAQAQCGASIRHFMGLVSEQSLYNLCDRMIELEVISVCRAYGIGIIPWSPLKEGLLGGVLQKEDKQRSSNERIKTLIEKYYNQLKSFESFCEEIGEKPANLALAWLLNNPVVTSPIIGPRTIEQLIDGIRSLDINLSEDSLKKLDEIWPGPGGEAPKAYAW